MPRPNLAATWSPMNTVWGLITSTDQTIGRLGWPPFAELCRCQLRPGFQAPSKVRVSRGTFLGSSFRDGVTRSKALLYGAVAYTAFYYGRLYVERKIEESIVLEYSAEREGGLAERYRGINIWIWCWQERSYDEIHIMYNPIVQSIDYPLVNTP